MFKWLWRWRKPAEPTRKERRVAERYPCRGAAKKRLVAAVGPAGWPAAVSDLSATGIGMVVGVRQEPGTRLPVRLVHPGRAVACPMMAQVVYTERRPDGYWFTGCVFQGILNKWELEALL